MVSLLGEVSDGDVAAELGITRESVGYKRVVLAIAAFNPRPPGKSSFNERHSLWTAEATAQLGRLSDVAIAATLGLRRGRCGYGGFARRRPEARWVER